MSFWGAGTCNHISLKLTAIFLSFPIGFMYICLLERKKITSPAIKTNKEKKGAK